MLTLVVVWFFVATIVFFLPFWKKIQPGVIKDASIDGMPPGGITVTKEEILIERIIGSIFFPASLILWSMDWRKGLY